MLMLVFPVVMFKSHPFMDSLKAQQCWWWWYWCYKLLERAIIHQHDCICISFPFWVVEGVVVVKVVLFTFIQILCEKSLPFGSFFVLGGSSDEYCRLEPIVLPLSFITPYTLYHNASSILTLKDASTNILRNTISYFSPASSVYLSACKVKLWLLFRDVYPLNLQYTYITTWWLTYEIFLRNGFMVQQMMHKSSIYISEKSCGVVRSFSRNRIYLIISLIIRSTFYEYGYFVVSKVLIFLWKI